MKEKKSAKQGNFTKAKKANKQDNFMTYIPEKKCKDFEVRDGKVYLIFHHDKPIEKFASWLVKKPRVTDIELDEIGSYIWLSMDGKRTVYDIGQKLEKKFGEKCEPIYDRLIAYLRTMRKSGYICFESNEKNI